MSLEEIMNRVASQNVGTQALLDSTMGKELEKVLSAVKDSANINQKEMSKLLKDLSVLLKMEGFNKEEVKKLVQHARSETSSVVGSGTAVSREDIVAFFSRTVNEAIRNKDLTVTKQMEKNSPFAAAVGKEYKKDVIRQEESKQLKTTMDKIHYAISGFFEDMKSSEPRKRKRFIDDLVDAIGQNKSIVGVFTDILKIVTLFSANWLRKFGTLGKVLGAAFILAGPTIAMLIGKKLLEVIGKAFGLLRLTPIPVIVMGYLGKGIVKGASLTKAGAAAGKTAMTGAKALGRTGIKASQLTRTVPQSASALRTAIMMGGATAMGAGVGARTFKVTSGAGTLAKKLGSPAVAKAGVGARTFKVTSGAGTLAKKLGSPAVAKAATKAGGKVAAKAGGRFAALIPGAAVVSGAALTALSGKMAWDSFKEGDMVGGAAFGVSTIASIVQMLAGNIPGIGTAVSVIAGAIGFIADMIGIFHKEIGEFIKGFWDKFKDTIFSTVKGAWEGVKDFFSKSGLFGSPAEAHGIPTIDPSRVDSATKVIKSSKNSAMIWDYFKKKGFSDEGIAGLMGNLSAESGLEFNRLQGDFTTGRNASKIYTSGVNEGSIPFVKKNNIGYGLAQWTSADRKRNLQQLAKARGVSIDDPQLQLDFLYYELEKMGLARQLKSATSVSAASNLILKKFERPADQGVGAQTTRASLGQAFFNQFKETSVNVGTPVASNKSSDLTIKKEEPKKAETPKEEKSVKVAEEPNKSTQVLQGSFPQGTSNAQAPALPKVDFSGTRTASNILNGVTNIVNVGADAAYQIV